MTGFQPSSLIIRASRLHAGEPRVWRAIPSTSKADCVLMRSTPSPPTSPRNLSSVTHHGSAARGSSLSPSQIIRRQLAGGPGHPGGGVKPGGRATRPGAGGPPALMQTANGGIKLFSGLKRRTIAGQHGESNAWARCNHFVGSRGFAAGTLAAPITALPYFP
jgi:hypothetical protein